VLAALASIFGKKKAVFNQSLRVFMLCEKSELERSYIDSRALCAIIMSKEGTAIRYLGSYVLSIGGYENFSMKGGYTVGNGVHHQYTCRL
jgi:hypothetical protein